MKDKGGEFDLRLWMVLHAIQCGIKPTARLFDTVPKTVWKWVNRYKQERLTGLNELPRISHHCPAPCNSKHTPNSCEI